MKIEEYYHEFQQDLLAESGVAGEMLADAFVEKLCAIIAEQGVMPDADLVNYRFNSGNVSLAVDAWARDPERGHLSLLVADFRNSDLLETLTNTDIEKTVKRLDRFVERCAKREFVECLEDSDPVVPLARHLYEQRDNIRSIDFILLTNARISTRIKEIKPSEYNVNNAQKCEVWDFQRLFELEASGRERETIEVDFTEYAEDGIECLRASTGEASLKSYLFVLPGQVLAELYGKHGERLLEQNVRMFLQFRGNVNKGIRNTIVQHPEMFFAYNNGLSATGEAVKTSPDGRRILNITNLQIVNGGQTTASVFTAWRYGNANLQNLFVQVKLSVVESEKVNEIVPKISEYANTQNKVNAADFFSNHPFHLRIEEFSRRLWAPAADGSPRQTHWFYERARGQYINAQANLSDGRASEFLRQNPKNQVFTKTDLAKSCLSFWKMPHLVSRGAQFAFAGSPGVNGFAKLIGEEWDAKNGDTINERWFKEGIARAIVFKGLDKALTPILKKKNFGSYKACIVAYTLSKFMAQVEACKKTVNFERIWNSQTVAQDLLDELVRIADLVTEFLVSQQTHVVQLAKTEACWRRVEALPIDLSDTINEHLQWPDEQQHEERMAVMHQRIVNGIHSQQYVVEKGETYWWKVRDWNENHQIFSPKEIGVLNVACQISKGKIPSERQAKVLISAESRAIEEGFFVE